VGVIGVGYWGPNLLRNFNIISGAEARWAADVDEARLQHIATLYPNVTTTRDYRAMLDDDDTHAIVVATPADTHCRLSCEALEAGKHVFVEKPMAVSEAECRQMVQAARACRPQAHGRPHLFVQQCGPPHQATDRLG
jgi:predicted dehydrogenase